MDKPAVIIYSDHLLPISQTFVLAQGEALQSYTPCYVGSRLVTDLPLPKGRHLTVNRGGILGRVREAAHLMWRFDPLLLRQVRKLKPLLVHAHFGPDGVSALPLAQSLDIPLLVTFHGYDITVKDEYARRSFYRHRVYLQRRDLLKQQAARFIAVSDFIKEKLLKQGFPPDKVVAHYIGVNIAQFQLDASVVREPIVLFVGRLTEKKGCEYLIRAMKKVQALVPAVELVIIGDGNLRPSLEQLAQNTLQNYRFLGSQPPGQVRAWMNKAQVFSVPSVIAESGDAEAFGIVFAEAQAMGLPVVSFASGGIPEAVAHGETGFLATEKDERGLAEHILRLLKDETLWQQFSQRGQEWVRSKFDLNAQAQKLEKIYRSVLDETGTAR